MIRLRRRSHKGFSKKKTKKTRTKFKPTTTHTHTHAYYIHTLKQARPQAGAWVN